MGVYWKVQFFWGGASWKANGELTKKGGGAWSVCRFKGGGLGETISWQNIDETNAHYKLL